MRTLSVDLINEYFNTEETGESIGYGEQGIIFNDVECEDLEDYQENAEFGQCWTDENNITYFKIRNEYEEAESFFINDNGEIETV